MAVTCMLIFKSAFSTLSYWQIWTESDRLLVPNNHSPCQPLRRPKGLCHHAIPLQRVIYSKFLEKRRSGHVNSGKGTSLTRITWKILKLLTCNASTWLNPTLSIRIVLIKGWSWWLLMAFTSYVCERLQGSTGITVKTHFYSTGGGAPPEKNT